MSRNVDAERAALADATAALATDKLHEATLGQLVANLFLSGTAGAEHDAIAVQALHALADDLEILADAVDDERTERWIASLALKARIAAELDCRMPRSQARTHRELVEGPTK